MLDKKDLSAVTDDILWSDAKYATAFLDKLYKDNLPEWINDASVNSDETQGGGDVMYGQLVTSSIDVWYYDKIRPINLFLKKIQNDALTTDEQNSLKAQASCLRAWRYFQMVRVYGGVPLILDVQEITDDLLVKRSKTSECVNQIIKDLDTGIAGLPWRWTGADEGRLTKAGALALKGRVLLYFASPQFNPENNQERWLTAYNHNKEAIELLENNGYGLFDSYENIWFSEMNKEALLVQRYQEPGRIHNWDAATRPLSEAQNATGANQPTLEMVKSYPMKDGVSITESNEYDPILFWKNRDPRFASSIAYNSVLWELSGKSGRRQWTYAGAELNMGTATGFYCRKAINLSYTPYFTERSSTDWIEIRFAEVLLNYAECAAELGKTNEAYDVLKKIRKRAGIESGNKELYGLKQAMNKKEMLQAIMLERKIEFAFEGKRYWDLRRRRLYQEELNGKQRHGIIPKLKIDEAEFLKIKDNINFEKDYGVYFKDSVVLLDKVFTINFKDNYYFYAIPNKHLEANSNLEQTAGWDEGTFNPLD